MIQLFRGILDANAVIWTHLGAEVSGARGSCMVGVVNVAFLERQNHYSELGQ